MGFEIGHIMIPYYGFCIAIGILAAGSVGIAMVHMFHRDVNDFITLAAMVGLGGLLGAKVLYLILSWEEIDFSRLTEAEYLSVLLGSGFVFYGGLIGGLLAALFCMKFLRIDVPGYISIAMPCIPIAHGFGRIGCSLVGCCYGIPYAGPGAICYTDSWFAPNDVPLFPVQLTEAILNFLIAGALLLYIWRNRGKMRNSLLLYLMLYATVRFILEFLRYDDVERGIFLGVSTSQWISILVFAGAVCFYIIRKKKGSRTDI